MVSSARAEVASYELQAARFRDKDNNKVSVFPAQTTPPYRYHALFVATPTLLDLTDLYDQHDKGNHRLVIAGDTLKR